MITLRQHLKVGSKIDILFWFGEIQRGVG